MLRHIWLQFWWQWMGIHAPSPDVMAASDATTCEPSAFAGSEATSAPASCAPAHPARPSAAAAAVAPALARRKLRRLMAWFSLYPHSFPFFGAMRLSRRTVSDASILRAPQRESYCL